MAKIIINHHGDKEYRDELDRKHRLDGPAWISPSGQKLWYVSGRVFCEDGPAYIGRNGIIAWATNLENKAPHKVEGPARDYPNGQKEWIVDGETIWPVL